ncbi:Asparagine synthetase [glutamine-hydrolyzing] [hydrothermal vent metagenome]|uniref:Asparagine synthetase [glutamine-hydrolyzing] n=1 Tax=hydrothermal vent metagenome TaxID=652676 RepID=A0A3B0XWR7_9ZZZZ
MCGICGEFRFDSQQASSSLIHQMLPALEKRGPDSEGVFQKNSIALGHRRLAIIDLSDKAAQPMRDPTTNNMLVFNGSIYNYPELRQELIALGHSFRSSGDTEVILNAYSEWGAACVTRLHGMFAFVIWDERNQQLFMARDRFGIKPLYYSHNKKRIVFASNTQALLKDSEVDRSIDQAGLHFQFSLHAVIPAPRTILKGVRKLPPAHTMTVNVHGETKTEPYWSLNACRPTQTMSEQDWVDATHEALMRAVKKRKIIADVPVGVLLSGGLDSSLLVALLVEAGVDDLQTFSVGFEDHPNERGSEFEFSDQVVARYGTRHHKFSIANEQVLQRLPEAVDAMSEPMVGQDAIGFYLLSEQVSQQVKVVQSGQGADEVFGGYFWYPQMMNAQGSVLDRFANHYFDRDHSEYLQMISEQYTGEDYTSRYVQAALTQANADEYLDQVLRFDTTTLVVDDPVKRVDNMTMAYGLEARVPFLDHELVELAAQIPPQLKLQSGGKHILKRIARGRVPDEVIDRPKGYFPVPALKFVRGEFLQFMQDILHSDACQQRGLFRPAYTKMLLSDPERYLTRIQGSKLWHMVLLEYWLQRHVD